MLFISFIALSNSFIEDIARHESQNMTAIGIVGSKGRMGQALFAAINEAGHSHAGGVDQGEDISALVNASDVLVDFSSPTALQATLDACVAANTPIVVGTTGLDESHHAAIDNAATYIPIVQTGNTSLGVNMLAALVEQAASKLGDDWDIEIVEMHHRHKVDAPSGTAKLLGEAAASGRNIDLATNRESGRDGISPARAKGAIGFAALRGGSVAGDHTVILASDEERIELTHRAENRMIFARGSMKAAGWLVAQDPGRYDMKDVLKL
ncbi:MAG: 4-hydroxy-tetrahydrodipicolinate reductase [Parasphingorhabdus sp.]